MCCVLMFFFVNDTATTEIYTYLHTLSLHDALPIFLGHSMGGLIATLLLIEHQRDFAAAALSGPAILTPAPLSRLPVWISRLLSRHFPRAGVMKLDPTGVSRRPAGGAALTADPSVPTGNMYVGLRARTSIGTGKRV